MDCKCQLFQDNQLPKRLKNIETKPLKKMSIRDKVRVAEIMKKSNIQSNKVSGRVAVGRDKKTCRGKEMEEEDSKKNHTETIPKLGLVKSHDRLTHHRNRPSELCLPHRVNSPQNIYQQPILPRPIQNITQRNKIRPKVLVIAQARLTAETQEIDSPYLLRQQSSKYQQSWQTQPTSPKQFQLGHKRSATSCLASPRINSQKVTLVSSLEKYQVEPIQIVEASRDIEQDFKQSQSSSQFSVQQKLSNLFPKFAVSRKDTQYMHDESVLSGFSQVIYIHSLKKDKQSSETLPHSIKF